MLQARCDRSKERKIELSALSAVTALYNLGFWKRNIQWRTGKVLCQRALGALRFSIRPLRLRGGRDVLGGLDDPSASSSP